MKLPVLRGNRYYKKQVVNFRGVNYTQNFSEGEFSSASGISHLAFPALTQKRACTKLSNYQSPSWAGFTDRECAADLSSFYYDGKSVGELSEKAENVAVMGSIIAIFPEKKYYNIKTNEFGSMEAAHVFDETVVTFTANTLTAPEYFYRTESCIEEKTVDADATVNV